MRLGALFSGGKDSTYALYLAQKSGHSIECLMTMKSENTASYMFHSANINVVHLQAKALDIPLIEEATEGKKEEELVDLKKLIVAAKEKYRLDGITTGALYSDYQRERIEKMCDDLGIACISPTWHKDQEQHLRDIIDDGFSFLLSAIAADGLDKAWLGHVITHEDVDKLVALNEKIGLNIAFEGGEAESLVIDGPLFHSRIVVKEAKIVMENEFTGMYQIVDAELKKNIITESGPKIIATKDGEKQSLMPKTTIAAFE